jgi:hypothetical protein
MCWLEPFPWLESDCTDDTRLKRPPEAADEVRLKGSAKIQSGTERGGKCEVDTEC